MKIAVSLSGDRIGDLYGESSDYVIYDADGSVIRTGTVVSSAGSVQKTAAEFLYDLGADVLLCGGIRRQDEQGAASRGIRLIKNLTGEPEAAAEAYLGGTLVSGPDPVRAPAAAEPQPDSRIRPEPPCRPDRPPFPPQDRSEQPGEDRTVQPVPYLHEDRRPAEPIPFRRNDERSTQYVQGSRPGRGPRENEDRPCSPGSRPECDPPDRRGEGCAQGRDPGREPGQGSRGEDCPDRGPDNGGQNGRSGRGRG